MEKILEVKDLHVSFRTHFGEARAVRGVSFEIYKGETVAIVGESGCGKSVTAQAIMKLLPNPPAIIRHGSIMFEGTDIVRNNDKQMQKIRGNDMAMVFQDPVAALNPTMKIGAQIMEVFIKHHKLTRKAAYEKTVGMLELVGMAEPREIAGRYPHELSGGMCQRVMIAMALACRPKLLIADEPTTALDATIQAQILELMADIQKKLRTSIIMITHDFGVVARMCSRVLVMYAGEIVESGSLDKVFYNPCHPYTKGLLNSVPRLDIAGENILHPVAGIPPDLFNPPEGCPFFARCKDAMEVCRRNDPQMQKIEEGHFAACWHHHPIARRAGYR